MTTKQYLDSVYRIDKIISNKLVEIYQLKTLASNISVANDGEKVISSINPDKLGDSVAKIVDMEREVDALVDELLEKKKNIVLQIESMENTEHYNFLFLRYIKRASYKDIEEEMHYSRVQLWRIHEDAMNEFEKKYGSEYL